MGSRRGPSATTEPLVRYAGLTGEAMGCAVVAREVSPASNPLGAENKVVLAPRAGRAPQEGPRLAVACRSPLRGGIASSRGTGSFGAALLRLGFGAVIVEEAPRGDDTWIAVVDGAGASLAIENGFRSLGTRELVARLREAHGPSAAIVAIGPAGEWGLRSATVTCATDAPRPTSHCGLGGAGAVMGAKRLKAIVVAGAPAPGAAGPPDAARGAPRQGAGRSPYREACGIEDPLVTARLESLEDDLGFDACEVASAIAIAMAAGLARRGDGQATLSLVEEIARGTPLGRILGSGVRATGEALGIAPSSID
jgi:aldehyde:ferredoxin oxidoreductase